MTIKKLIKGSNFIEIHIPNNNGKSIDNGKGIVSDG